MAFFIESRILLVILIQPLDLACFYIVYSAGDLLLSEQRILFRGKGSADLLAGAEDIPVAGRKRVFFLTDGFPDGYLRCSGCVRRLRHGARPARRRSRYGQG